jgi:ABC-type glycerol-3-phosphate transport system substrate-binding protein
MKKILSILLFSAVLLITVSCGNENADNSGTDSGTSAPDTGEMTETAADTTDYKADYLPENMYDGYEFRIIVPDAEIWDLTTTANVEEETGDTVNDAIYKRNRLVEGKYDVKFKQITLPDLESLRMTFAKSTSAGSDDFDLCMLISRHAWAAALNGSVTPVNDLPYLDISQPWYAHDVNSEISINGKLYFAYSDECLNMFELTLGVLFNKKLTEDLSLGNMYSLVQNNEWTIDKFFGLSKTASADLNGDGEMMDSDRYGILSQFDMLYPCFWVSGGIKTVSKDNNDLLVFTGNGEKLFSVLDKVYQNIYAGEKIYFDTFQDKISSFQYSDQTQQRRVSVSQFENNQGLFYVTGIGNIPALRAMESDFGILPFPKYDEAQEKYYSRVIDGWINCVPNTAQDLERTSIIMEALAVESKNITIPAYFEVALRTKYARDNESQEMLDIIHANRTMDIGDTFYYDNVRLPYTDLLVQKKNDFASMVEKITPSVNKNLQEANNAAVALD